MSVSFTAEQQHAIESRTGSLFLHASAGSGKTSVLVERFVRAVLEDGVGVDRILAITFTEKAAAELKLRIRRRFLELGKREEARAAEGAWISTIHGFCSRLLRTHPLAAGIDPEYRVLDEPESERIGIDAFERALEAFLAQGPGEGGVRLELLAAYTPQKLEGMVRTVHSRLRSRGERHPALPPLPDPEESDGGEARELEAALQAALAEAEASGSNGVTVDPRARPHGPLPRHAAGARRAARRARRVRAANAQAGHRQGAPDAGVRAPRRGAAGLPRLPARGCASCATTGCCASCSRSTTSAIRASRRSARGSTSRTSSCSRATCWRRSRGCGSSTASASRT